MTTKWNTEYSERDKLISISEMCRTVSCITITKVFGMDGLIAELFIDCKIV